MAGANFLGMPEYPIHGSKYFDVREWVDQRTWSIMGAGSAQLIDPTIIRVFDLLREKSGPIKVNDWHAGGRFKASGFRAIWEKTGGQLSQHRCGRAGDGKSSRYRPMELFEIIMEYQVEFKHAGLTCIEALEFTPTWIHLDCRPVVAPADGFVMVRP